MKPYGYNTGFGWVGKTEDNTKIEFATEEEYNEYCTEVETETK